ncbi:hypothetical protein O181_000543 [Austropuccinia psidii MF-1]|uniref:Uncharacterized protein n=1 Tax=Austropuccinia psidii MF-1 TaxID=1389203 RepID=A0A9Q3B914_9BASI|nr:hypothetical protein [Austropuccinia psidii MF-1]
MEKYWFLYKSGTEKPRKRSGRYSQEHCGSGEDHRAIRRKESILQQRKGKKDEEFVEKSKYFIHRPRERTGNDPRIGERRASSVNHLQKSPKTSQKDLKRKREAPRPIKERAKETTIGTDITHKGT